MNQKLANIEIAKRLSKIPVNPKTREPLTELGGYDASPEVRKLVAASVPQYFTDPRAAWELYEHILSIRDRDYETQGAFVNELYDREVVRFESEKYRSKTCYQLMCRDFRDIAPAACVAWGIELDEVL